jgi:hypothetical protein
MNSKGISVLGKPLIGVIPTNEAASYAHHSHLNITLRSESASQLSSTSTSAYT